MASFGTLSISHLAKLEKFHLCLVFITKKDIPEAVVSKKTAFDTSFTL